MVNGTGKAKAGQTISVLRKFLLEPARRRQHRSLLLSKNLPLEAGPGVQKEHWTRSLVVMVTE
jgi:hypothetical protein